MLLQCVAVVIAASCAGDVSDDDESFRTVPPSNAEEKAIADLAYAMHRDLSALRTRPMSDEQSARLDAAEARVQRALKDLRTTYGRGLNRGFMMARIGGVSAALVADNATVVGAVDDGLLILCGIAAVVTIITTNADASPHEMKESWDELRSSLVDLKDAIAAVTTEVCTATLDLAQPANELQSTTEAEAESTTRATAEPLADTARRHGRNQKCSNDELSTLQRMMKRACKGKGQNTCSSKKRSAKRLARLKCSEVLRRQAMHEACLATRRRIQKRCFRSTDSGHGIAIRQRKDAIESCRHLAAQQCAPDSPYNDQ